MPEGELTGELHSNWLLAGSVRSGQRAPAAMSLTESAHLNGHDPCLYLTDVLQRLPSQRASAMQNCYRTVGHLPTRCDDLTVTTQRRTATLFQLH